MNLCCERNKFKYLLQAKKWIITSRGIWICSEWDKNICSEWEKDICSEWENKLAPEEKEIIGAR